MENWKDIVNYEGLYKVSSLGRIKSIKNDAILTPKNNQSGSGYMKIGLWKDKVRSNFKICRLVAIAFIPNIENKRCVDHIDGNSLNDRVENLRWATSQENAQNRKGYSGGSSIYKGISFDKRMKKWRARITLNNKLNHLGFFDCEIEAHKAYDEAAKKYFGQFAKINAQN